MDKIDVATAELVVENLAGVVTAPVWLLDHEQRVLASSPAGDRGQLWAKIESGPVADQTCFTLPSGERVVL
nr:hypothetical protein [Chloroflexota bacterium]